MKDENVIDTPWMLAVQARLDIALWCIQQELAALREGAFDDKRSTGHQGRAEGYAATWEHIVFDGQNPSAEERLQAHEKWVALAEERTAGEIEDEAKLYPEAGFDRL